MKRANLTWDEANLREYIANRASASGPRLNGWAALDTLAGVLRALHHPQDAAVIARVLAIPPKRFDRAVITYLTEEEITAMRKFHELLASQYDSVCLPAPDGLAVGALR